MLGVDGWFSTNILGNRDGEVLDDPGSFRSKEVSKLGALDYIFQPEQYPELYGDLHHKVRINYYPPRGDNKEGWDNIDIFGWVIPCRSRSTSCAAIRSWPPPWCSTWRC
jgi:myo-inositol-1-phosphate synthase